MLSKEENYQALKQGLRDLLPISAPILRPAQQEVLRNFLFAPDENTRGIFELATAFGKTRIMKLLAMSYLKSEKSGQVLILVPTQDLIEQTFEKLKDFHHSLSDIGQFYALQKETEKKIIVSTYHSLKNLQTQIDVQNVGLVLLDEAHHAISENRSEMIRLFSNACCYGMTATPFYNEDYNLSDLLGNTLARIDVPQSVKDGSLASFKNILLVSKVGVDLSQIHKVSSGEYDQTEYYQALKSAFGGNSTDNTDNWQAIHEKIARQIAEFYRDFVDEETGERASTRQCLINCRSQEEAHIQARVLNRLFGRLVAAVWTSDSSNKKILTSFEKGKLPILCQVGKLEEGYDYPAVSLCINYPTSSRVRSAQRGGRVLRLDETNPNKNAWIVDMVFSHPDAPKGSATISARLNNQVLYADIVHTIVIQPKRKQILKEEQNESQLTFKKEPSVQLQDFEIISNTELLLQMENERKQYDEKLHLPQRTKNMLTARELTTQLKIDVKKHIQIAQCFQDAYKRNITISINNKKQPLIIHAKSGTKSACFLYDNTQEAINAFLNIYANTIGYEYFSFKKEDMLTSYQLASILKINPAKNKIIADCFKDAHKNNITICINGQETPLIVYARSGTKYAFFLHDNTKDVIDAFLLHYADTIGYKDLPQKTENMLAAYELASVLKITRQQKKILDCFEDAYKNNVTICINGQETPLIVYAKATTACTLFLCNNTKEVIDAFLLRYADTIGYKDLPQKTENMLAAYELASVFKITRQRKKISACFEDAYKNNITIRLKEKEFPLIIQVRSGSNSVLCLRDNTDTTINAFWDKYADVIGYKKLPQKTSTMLTAHHLSSKLKKTHLVMTILKCFEDAYKNNLTVSINNQKEPLVILVKSCTKSVLCLRDNTDTTINAFLEYYGKVLRTQIRQNNFQAIPIASHQNQITAFSQNNRTDIQHT